jgi:hypothetical protein
VSRSTASGSKVAHGKTLTNGDTGDALARLRKVLREVYREHVRVKSDYARKEADIVAMAASLQLITTKVGAQRFAKTWLITSKGLTWLNEEED